MSLPLWPADAQARLYDTLGYRVGHPETTRFLLNWDQRTHVVICPARASKSYSASKKALPMILGREALPDGAGPRPTRGWIVGPTYELAEKEFRYLWDDLVRVGPQELGWPKPVISRDSKKGGDLYLLTAWGSEVVGKSADKPQSLLGEALDWVILSEAAQLPGEIWTRYLEPRLATTKGYAFLPTTPDAGAVWLHDLYIKGLEGSNDIASYTWPVSGNPTYPLEELEAKRRLYGDHHPVFREQYLGEWTFYSGTVYGHDFDPARNIVDDLEIPADWRRLRAIDFGYRDPFVCLWLAVAEPSERLHTQRGDLVVYREYYHEGRAMAQHAEALRALSGDEQILYTVADSSEPQSIADLRRLGVPALEANRDRRAGRMLVGDYLRTGRLRFVRRACPHTLREISYYRWDTDKNKEGAKELTVGDDHAMDALRYAVMSRPQPQTHVPRLQRGTFAHEMLTREIERKRAQWPTLAAWGGR